MNESAENRSRRRASKFKKLEVASSIEASDSDPQPRHRRPSVVGGRGSPKVYEYLSNYRLPTDWDQQAKHAFFYDYVEGSRNGRGGYLDFLPALYQEQSNKPYFAEALAAVSMASFANRTSIEHLVFRARRSYGRALFMINEALNSEAEAKSDCLLTSLFLIGKYENISGDKATLFETHGPGQIELLRLRGAEQFGTSRGRNLYNLVHSRQRLQDLNQRRRPNNLFNASFDKHHPGPHAMKLARILAKVTELYSAVPCVSNEPLHRSGWEIRALDLEQEMHRWIDDAPEMLHYWSIFPSYPSVNTDPSTSHLYPKSMFIFKNIQVATGWNVFWCGRIYLLRSMLEYRNGLTAQGSQDSVLPSESEIYQSLQDTVDNICATVPFLLGEVDSHGALSTESRRRALGGYYLVWSLHVTGSVRCLPFTQEAWIADRLMHIGHVFGIKQAFLFKQYRVLECAGRYKQNTPTC